MRTVRSAFGKETVGARGGGRCKIEGRWVMWINLAAARSIQRQFHGTWKWIRRVGFTLLKNVCVVFCVMRCHLCDALQNRDYSWFSGTCGDYHPCHLRLILAAGQRSGGISHISPSLRCRRKIPKKDFLSQRDFFGFHRTISHPRLRFLQHIGKVDK